MTHHRYPGNMLIWFFALLLLAACGSEPVRGVMPQKGLPLDELIRAYGPAKSVTPSSDGYFNHYVWKLSTARLVTSDAPTSTTVTASGQIASPTQRAPQVKRVYCTLEVTAGVERTVQDWKATGDGCRQILLNEL